MSRGVYVALSGMVAQEQALDATATNLANATTSGYQRMRPVFHEALARAQNGRPAVGGKTGKESLRYTEVAETALDGTRGAIRQTGKPLDLALPDNNYLAVSTPRGERFTRAGSLTMAQDGTLKTSSGQTVAREDGQPIQLSPTGGQAAITADGSVMQDGAVVAKLKIVKADPATTKMAHEGADLVTVRAGAVTPSTDQVEVGVVEDSNASTVGAMTDMVNASRTFEAFQKMLDTFGECDRKVLTTVPQASE